MLNIVMSRAASGLLRALLERAGNQRDRILLSEIQSVDWQSLTFVGERHVIRLRVPGPGADRLVVALLDGIEEAEFSVPGQIVADIAAARLPDQAADGSVSLAIEALTIVE